MVKVIPLPKQEEVELPDFYPTSEEESKQAPAQIAPEETWRLSNFKEIEEDLRDTVKKKGITSVDPISIALKNNPMPVKDVKRDWVETRTTAWYGGNNIIDYLREDKFEIKISIDAIETLKIRVSRWALIDVHDHLISKKNRAGAEIKAQHDKVHGHATIKTPNGPVTPSDFACDEDGIQLSLIHI